jgi:large subunit ribosomal protein L22
MQATARARFLRGSARKMRIVVDLIRGKSVDDALNLLSVLPQAAAVPIRKTLFSATSNALAAEGTANLKSEDLRVTRAFVDGGPSMKRIRPMAMGRAYRIQKRMCHLTIMVEGEHLVDAPTVSTKSTGKKKAGTAAPSKGATTTSTKSKKK